MKTHYKNSINLLKNKKATVGVIGMGYVGLPLAILFAKKGFKVHGFDIDNKKIKLLNKKRSYIERIESSEIKYILKKGKCFNTFENIVNCDFIVICVPTPLKKNNIPDLSYVKKTFLFIKKYLRQGQTLILESTSYPGTTREEIVDKLKNKFDIGNNFFIGFSSERINPGFNENKISSIPKVVSGYSKNCLDIVSKFYQKSFFEIVKAKNIEIAEFSKLLENIYRAVNIGFINEMKFVADKMNLDIFEIIKVARTKPFGFRPFDPGPGIGGHCIPIDPHYLYWKAKKKGIKADFIKLSSIKNSKVLFLIKNKIYKILNEIKKDKKKVKILILGVGYKKNIDDIRESASISLAKLLAKNFKNISFSDPHVKNIKEKSFTNKKSLNLSSKTLKSHDIVILMTDHDKFNYPMIYKNSKKIIDCRGRYSLNEKVMRA